MQTEFTLTKPITVHGKTGAEEITVLKLKEPTGDLVLTYGAPYTSIIENDPRAGKQRIEVKMEPKIFREYVKAMTGLDGSAVGQIRASDLVRLFGLVMNTMNETGGTEGNSA